MTSNKPVKNEGNKETPVETYSLGSFIHKALINHGSYVLLVVLASFFICDQVFEPSKSSEQSEPQGSMPEKSSAADIKNNVQLDNVNNLETKAEATK